MWERVDRRDSGETGEGSLSAKGLYLSFEML
jgi:hypothetical protein